jgi:hypothetical protein
VNQTGTMTRRVEALHEMRPDGSAFMAFHFAEAAANLLTIDGAAGNHARALRATRTARQRSQL